MTTSTPAPGKRGRGRPQVGPYIRLAVPPDLLAELKAAAKAKDITMSEEIRQRLRGQGR